MQEQPFDTEAVVERAGAIAHELRRSEAYPAIIGGLAGGLAGGIIALLIAGRAGGAGRSSGASRAEVVTAGAVAQAAHGWSLRDLIQLITVVASLARQGQEWYSENKRWPS